MHTIQINGWTSKQKMDELDALRHREAMARCIKGDVKVVRV